jgi:hypothetical protein
MKAIGSVSEDKIIGKIIIVINRLMFYWYEYNITYTDF